MTNGSAKRPIGAAAEWNMHGEPQRQSGARNQTPELPKTEESSSEQHADKNRTGA